MQFIGRESGRWSTSQVSILNSISLGLILYSLILLCYSAPVKVVSSTGHDVANASFERNVSGKLDIMMIISGLLATV